MKIIALLVLLSAACYAQVNFTTVTSFNGTNGSTPGPSALIVDNSGNLWGTTEAGGSNNAGTVFEISGGVLLTVYSFCSQASCADGSTPIGGLKLGGDGKFYGTTSQGGANGCGTFFSLSSSGTLTTIHSFCADSSDGASPQGAPFGDSIGGNYNLIDVTTFGGGSSGTGTIFAYDFVSAKSETFDSFCAGQTCGAHPAGSVVAGYYIDMLGTASSGGMNNAGTIFTLHYTGLGTAYYFCSQANCADGANPGPTLTRCIGSCYLGVTSAGGANGRGTVFAFNHAARNSVPFHTLHSFCAEGSCTDSAAPVGGVVVSPKGITYGTTTLGGANQEGTLYGLSADGKAFTTVYSFCALPGCPDGQNPSSDLVEVGGRFYGTTSTGGANGMGTVYSFTAP